MEMVSHRSITSGVSTAEQLADEVKALPQEDRKQLLESGVFSSPTGISAENALHVALKAYPGANSEP